MASGDGNFQGTKFQSELGTTTRQHRARFGFCLLGTSLLLALSACSSDEDTGEKRLSGETEKTADAGPDGATESVALKDNCGPDDLPDGPACSSYNTPTAGGPDAVTELGPYGAVMDVNVGEGFELPVNPSEAGCAQFAAIFGEDPKLTEDVLDLRNTDLELYNVFRPANWVEGEKYPIITWGNGTCAQPGSYAALLMHVASHGFIVVAANSRYVGGNGAMSKALDMMFAANDDSSSPYYGRVDTDNVGAMGHSQGSGATAAAAATDDRIDAVILFNAGTSATKPFLAVSGDRDIGNPTVASYANGTNSAPKGAYLFYHKIPMTGGTLTGHLTLMMEPNRVTEATTGWWKMMLTDDAEARDLFVGDDCGLCGHDEDFEFGEHGL